MVYINLLGDNNSSIQQRLKDDIIVVSYRSTDLETCVVISYGHLKVGGSKRNPLSLFFLLTLIVLLTTYIGF